MSRLRQACMCAFNIAYLKAALAEVEPQPPCCAWAAHSLLWLSKGPQFQGSAHACMRAGSSLLHEQGMACRAMVGTNIHTCVFCAAVPRAPRALPGRQPGQLPGGRAGPVRGRDPHGHASDGLRRLLRWRHLCGEPLPFCGSAVLCIAAPGSAPGCVHACIILYACTCNAIPQ